MGKNLILIIDFGSQVTQLIARRVRESGFYCVIEPFSKITLEFIKELSPSALILSGGPSSVLDEGSPSLPSDIFHMDLPILGICYGQQLMCHLLGGKVAKGTSREFGRATLEIVSPSPLTSYEKTKEDENVVWMSHGDYVEKIPESFIVLAKSDGAPYAVIAHKEKDIYGVQFHPEVSHTVMGTEMLQNFCQKIAKLTPSWNMNSFKDIAIENIKKQVGDRHVICALSGGVDSTVVAVLLSEALPKQVTCIFVDHGLLRTDEARGVTEIFTKHYQHIPFIACDYSELFLSNLKDVTDPEQKRKIIGKLFIDVFEKETKKIFNGNINPEDFLAQGTLYPDIIESVSIAGGGTTIKSHHNVGGLPDVLPLKILEPVRDLFKDEVRALGLELGLPKEMINRHPFPGPGLAIRILSDVTKEKCDILRQADKIYIEEIRKNNLYDEIWQAFAVLLPVQTVGVMGDARTYENVCALRAVTSLDGMTAVSYPFKHDFLAHVASRIINEVPGINRVVYDCTSKPPSTIEWE